MSNRPRPVTATVTKPGWMQIPNPETKAMMRNLSSHGSDDSLASILDKVNSYSKDSDIEEDLKKKDVESEEENFNKTFSASKENDEKLQQRLNAKNEDEDTSRNISPVKSVSAQSIESRLSAWEQWIVHKAKENQIKKREEKFKKQEEEALKKREEQEKQNRLKKAETVRQQWTAEKNRELIKKKKQEKLLKNNERIQKEEIDKQVKQKAEEKYSLWSQLKNKEESERRKKIKEENKKIQEHEEMRRSMAEAKFKEWLKQAAGRPRSAPNSFGYLSGKMTGYHDRSAYPTPTFVNPKPWTPVTIAPQYKTEVKAKKSKVKAYKWNPDKYF